LRHLQLLALDECGGSPNDVTNMYFWPR
jgi:hypothetical protein